MLNTPVASAIITCVGVVFIAVPVIITMVFCFIGNQRDHTQEKRASVNAPVIDICRLASVEEDSYMAEPQRPRLAYLSIRQPSPSIRVVSGYDDTLCETGLHGPSGRAKPNVDLEAQSWKPTREKKCAKAERFYTLSCISPFVELPISPPPSYSQIDKSLLVTAPSLRLPGCDVWPHALTAAPARLSPVSSKR